MSDFSRMVQSWTPHVSDISTMNEEAKYWEVTTPIHSAVQAQKPRKSRSLMG